MQSVLHTMEQAHQYINIAVMDYIPAMLYTPHHQYIITSVEHFITTDKKGNSILIDTGQLSTTNSDG